MAPPLSPLTYECPFWSVGLHIFEIGGVVGGGLMRFWGGEVQDPSAGMAVFNEGFEGLEGLEGCWEGVGRGAEGRKATALYRFMGTEFEVSSFQVPHTS